MRYIGRIGRNSCSSSDTSNRVTVSYHVLDTSGVSHCVYRNLTGLPWTRRKIVDAARARVVVLSLNPCASEKDEKNKNQYTKYIYV